MAGRIPQSFIDDLLGRVDIVEIIDSRVPLKRAGKEYKACCPFHEERTPSFTVSSSKQFYHCFGCGVHGTAITFLMEYAHLDFREAINELASGAGVEVPTEGDQPRRAQNSTASLRQLMVEANQFFGQQLREHPKSDRVINYLKQRGLSGEVTAEFELGFAPPGWSNLLDQFGKDDARRKLLFEGGLIIKKESGGFYDRFRDRVMFPIHDHRGRVVGFGGRILDQGEPKYLNSPETPLFHKGSELYGLFRAKESIHKEQCCLIVEGYMDVVALAQHGIRNSVATLGTATTRQHLERLFRHVNELIFCFDGDRAGKQAAWRALESALPTLQDGRQVGFLFLPDGEDPDSLVRGEGEAAFRKRLSASTPLPDYLFDQLRKETDLNRLDGRARLVELARPLLLRLPDGVLRTMMFDRLTTLSQSRPGSLEEHFTSSPPSKTKAPLHSYGAFGQSEGRLSPTAKAIALLIQHPGMGGHQIDLSPLCDSDDPGLPLLHSIQEILTNNPKINTAALLEHFRETPHFRPLVKLVAWEHLIHKDNVLAEFEETIQTLIGRQRTRRIEVLLQKSTNSKLSAHEQGELTQLLETKNYPKGKKNMLY